MKIFVSVLMVLILAACGFTPMYGDHGAGASGLSATQGLDQVEIDLIPNESGVFLRNVLIDNFYRDGYPSSPRYRLIVREISENISDLDITVDSESTRRQISLSTNLVMIDLETNETVLERPVSALTSYNVLGSQFTTRVSEKDAREAALADLGRQIETQVALFFKR